jgi:hypothetical protein
MHTPESFRLRKCYIASHQIKHVKLSSNLNPTVYIFILLLLVTVVFIVVLLLPSWLELRKPKDAGPREMPETTKTET